MFSKEFLERTLQEWQPCSPELLTLADAEEICQNMIGLFAVLRKIDERLKRAKIANDAQGDAENGR